MNWFGGCSPGTRAVVPVGARVIWGDPPLWTAGHWPGRLLRTVSGRTARLAVLGPCAAGTADLARVVDSRDLSAATRAWGGSFTLVRRLDDGAVEVMTDAAGACPVYTVAHRGGVVWGSSSRALSGLTGGLVDTAWLAGYLADSRRDTAGRSAWSGVGMVPAGHRMLLRDGEMQISPWWTSAPRPWDDAAAALRGALREGVRAAVTGVATSCDLAGMDSSTLAVLAAEHGPVLGMTVHPAAVDEGGDVAYARTLAGTLPNLRHMLLPLEQRHSPLSQAPSRLPATDEPAPSSVTWSRLSAQLLALADSRVVCHLTGDGGDSLFLPPPTHLIDLAHARRWGRLAAEAQAWALLRRASPWGLVRAAVRGDHHALIGGGGRRPPWVPAAAPEPPAAPAHLGTCDALLLAEVRYTARSAHTEQQLAEAFGIELRNPFLDGPVLDAVLSAAPWRRCSATRYKPLLTAAVGSLLPPMTRERVTKGVFVGEFHRGVRANLRRALALADGRLAALGLVRPAPLRAALHAAALGAETAWPMLVPALNAELWLAAVEHSAAPRWHDLARAR
ncbi:albusnodin/ikarugamycin family macrolactam cyclase [Actinacidiphila epipremni]|uniref:albusnodin/ikarugamycin family macrolactam cyclase n=1 Tax=Actinacidiphila epipremni TaxID=2053013 RepID=UPI002AFE579B|nr:albusnodin/ikarugamycin family macrolactam cyclase [Actinacidiphila epipremni]